MLTVVCQSPGVLRAEDRPEPVRGDAEVLVRVKRVGVCGTDLHIFSGDQPYLEYPRVMGHEFSGVVADAPAGSRARRGRPGVRDALPVVRAAASPAAAARRTAA